jgi:fructose-specific phosphotransferase system IIA component
MSLKLVDLIDERCVLLNQHVTSKEALIHDVIERFAGADITSDAAEACRAVMKREEVMSTGIGGGVAIPHAQSMAVRQLAVGLIRPEEPIDFDSIDGRPVNLVFMILGPEERGGFVRVLARISRLLYDGELQSRLLSVRTARDAISAIAKKEESSRA